MTVNDLIVSIRSLDPEVKRNMPFPQDWILTSHDQMIRLVAAGIIGMDGFQYCFAEYAEDCWRRCHLKGKCDQS